MCAHDSVNQGMLLVFRLSILPQLYSLISHVLVSFQCCMHGTKLLHCYIIYSQLYILISCSFKEYEIIFGISGYKDNILKVINNVVILGKWYINLKKKQRIKILYIHRF